MTTASAATTLRSRFISIRDWLGRFPLSLLQLGMRVGVGLVFFNAGILKFQSFEFAVKLFEDEYKVTTARPGRGSAHNHVQ
jgi:putative oxidoreductase